MDNSTVQSIDRILDHSGNCQISHYTFNLKSNFLGEGSFGKVYKGIDKRTNEYVAIKIMNLKVFQDPYLKQSLKTEIKVMQQMKSEHCVRILDVYQDLDDFELYIILEFCQEGDLRKLLQKHQRLTEQQATEILVQLLEGFKELVNHGYIHRDIKPENVLIKNKVFKVADFGFATKIDITGHQKLKECVGTPIYMAPQLLSNTPYTAKSDIWSIGLMYYEMICGKGPWICRFDNFFLIFRNIESYMHCIYQQPLRFPEANDFIKKCLTIDENKRMGWESIFTHSLIALHNQKYNQQPLQQQPLLKKNTMETNIAQMKFDQQERLILKKLQDQAYQHGKNPIELLQSNLPYLDQVICAIYISKLELISSSLDKYQIKYQSKIS